MNEDKNQKTTKDINHSNNKTEEKGYKKIRS